MNNPQQNNRQRQNDPMGGFEQIFTQNAFFQNPEQFMRNAQNNGAHIHTSFSNNTSNNFNVYNNVNPNREQRNQHRFHQNYPQYHHSDQNTGSPFGFPTEEQPKNEKGMKRNTLKFNRQGNELYKQKKFRQALECYELGLDIEKHWKLYKNMAWCYKRLGLFKESVKYIKKAINLKDDDDVLFRLGGLFSFSLFSNSEKLSDGKLVQEFFRRAYELEQNETNYHNYMLGRKTIFLFLQQQEKREKDELIGYLLDKEENQSRIMTESDEENDDNQDVFSDFLTKNFFDKPFKAPEHLKGKISLEIMRNPILTLSGVSYEKENILRSFEENGWKDPTTNEEFVVENCLIYNTQLKKHIKDFLRKNKWGYLSDDSVKDWKLFEFK